MDFSTGKKEAKEKAKTRPQVDSNRCSIGPVESTLPSDPFYFVVIVCRLRETDLRKSHDSQQQQRRQYVEALAAAAAAAAVAAERVVYRTMHAVSLTQGKKFRSYASTHTPSKRNSRTAEARTA